MSRKSFQTSARKDEHIRICLNEDVTYRHISNGLENVMLYPALLPELDPEEINLETELLGKTLSAPIIISGMTGGSTEGKKVNESIAEVCNEIGIAMGVGSQRAALEDVDLIDTYKVRHIAPSIPIFGNLGLAQFINGFSVEEANRAVEMIDADALAIHVNPIQEFVQKEGDKNFRNSRSVLTEIAENFSYPLMIKGVGTGISVSDAQFLSKLKIDFIDVAGAGGTNWTKIEKIRHHNSLHLSEQLIEWGIPTSQSLLNMVQYKEVKQRIIGSGGVWSGFEAVKALLLGADFVAFALPALKILYSQGKEGLKKFINDYIYEMKIVMSLLNCDNITLLHKKRKKLLGITQPNYETS